MIRSVSALVLDGLAVFEFGVICEVFGIDRSADGVPNFDFKVCGPEPGKPVRTSIGATLTPDHGLDALIGADLVAIPAIAGSDYLPEALAAVRTAADAGSIILTVCSGAFLAGAAGLLDGRPCTTHWMHADELARMYPTARVDRNVLFVDDGNLITSAGTAAGIDACLHLVRRELGSEVTNKIARRMVVPPQRDGGQRQFIDQPIPVRCSDGFAPHLDWIISNLDKPHTVGTLAKRAAMSTRTFARRFVEETGTTPMQWITDQRVLYARRLLEETDLDIDWIAGQAGFGTATLLRHHFRRVIGVTPSDYRRRFACGAGVSVCDDGQAVATA
ncbi:GlxA family transcriptional regulator [Mycolicibacterium brisbanense]|uniref:Transcriptional regulator containing an amidase domain and an AraC-type DNA-binding HTH domain n=1 Tax=Mycolicibacterium brisbanense TaxID=146020 RepID=A0A117I4Y1_9MYCO|nr:helix-turn-helix domain-containing protein [Mycolicibacterium brisbanense]MCV7159253.1 helix-turn-helix domain-containing protein [Mycolicibacterium brisbanense]GAS87662.1 transcriptional regulator containing an amidase domain and an AraC-type DNA-binding HTH domain [Mycolicibacterium brisbanense]